MTKLGEMFGWGENPLYQLWNDNRYAATGLLGQIGKPGMLDATVRGAEVDRIVAGKKAEEADRLRAIQNTANYLRSLTGYGVDEADIEGLQQSLDSGAASPGEIFNAGFGLINDARQRARDRANAPFLQDPNLRAAVEAGNMTFADAMRLQNGGGQSAENFYGSPVYMQDENGNIVVGQMSNRNRFSPMQGAEGMSPAIPVQQLNTATGFTGVDKFGNPTGGSVPIDNAGAARDTAIGKGVGEQAISNQQAAAEAQQSLVATQEARKLLDSGMISGFGADFRVQFGKALQLAGINYAENEIANSEAFIATRAQEVGRLIQLYGSGTGLSDADRAYAEKAAAGTIQLSEESIRRILDINERAARNVILKAQQPPTMPGTTPAPPGMPGTLMPGTGSGGLPDPLGIR